MNVTVPVDPDTVNSFAELVLESNVLFKVKSPPLVLIVISSPNLTADANIISIPWLLDPTLALSTVDVAVKVNVPGDDAPS